MKSPGVHRGIFGYGFLMVIGLLLEMLGGSYR